MLLFEDPASGGSLSVDVAEAGRGWTQSHAQPKGQLDTTKAGVIESIHGCDAHTFGLMINECAVTL